MVRELKALAHAEDPYDTISGKTMCTSDFYEGQGRLDGAFCEFSETEKNEYLTKLQDAGVVNIEMECTAFASLTHHAGIKAGIVCVTLLDRFKGDQVGYVMLINFWNSTPIGYTYVRWMKFYMDIKQKMSILFAGQVCAPKEVLNEWQMRPQQLVSRYIKRYLQRKGRLHSTESHGSMCVKSPRRFKLVQQESENYE